MAEAKAEKKPGFFKKVAAYFKKVTWPTKKQVINNTIVVLVAIIIAGVVVWGLDSILTLLIRLLLQKA